MVQIQPSTIVRAQAGEESAKLCIIEAMQPMINKFKYSARFPSSWREDVEQQCILAILIAIDKFDILRSDNFPDYAKRYTKTEIEKLYNTCINPINLPVRVYAEYRAVQVSDVDASTTLSNGIKVDNIQTLLGLIAPNTKLAEEFEVFS